MSSELKIGDLVKVIKNDDTTKPYIDRIGYVGFIEQIVENYVSITCLDLDGTVLGGGAISIYCLELETSEIWKAAKTLYESVNDRCLTEGILAGKKWELKCKEIGDRHNLSSNIVDDIFGELINFRENEMWRN